MSRLNLGDNLILDTDYSTSEVKTGATWINGKPIYSKVVQCSFSSTSGQTSTNAHGVAGILEIVKYDAISTTNSPVWYKLPYCSGQTGTPYAIATVDRTNIYLGTTISGLLGRNCYVTIYYTKSTD